MNKINNCNEFMGSSLHKWCTYMYVVTKQSHTIFIEEKNTPSYM